MGDHDLKIAALIVAAGRGTRASGLLPKQYVRLGGRTVLQRTMDIFLAHPAIKLVLPVIHADDGALYAKSVSAGGGCLMAPVHGGDTRQDSVRRGLEALAGAGPDRVLIHDAARPFVDAGTIDRVLAALHASTGAIAAVRLTDTLKRSNGEGQITGTVDRAGLWRAQTPQGFEYAAIAAAHERAHAAGRRDFTDDAALAEWAGLPVALVEGTERNVKLTTAEDIAMAERALRDEWETRTGNGFDVHRVVPGDHVWLCGVRIPHSASLEGHSDADVALHALTDAVLGAFGAGDIGVHFPPSDPKWKGAASDQFLRHAANLVAEAEGRIINVDVTILAEAPKVTPHRAAMTERIAGILGVEVARVSVKATTTEGLGFTGRREGIAAIATATVSVPALRSGDSLPKN